MQNKMRTIWLTTITLVALLLSSIVSSTPLMPIQMAVANQVTVTDQTDATHQMTMESDTPDSHCASSMKNTVDFEASCCNPDNITSDHQCNAISCVVSFSLIIESVHSHTQPHSLILISKEPSRRISSIANALYKPPIA
ncbi:hypothetical protein [Vibrio sp. F74]|uniref:hypothetical protein n=1 Tax=Vibrio sp. F74 TaxID=700020 RepID=UPI0035F5F3D3